MMARLFFNFKIFIGKKVDEACAQESVIDIQWQIIPRGCLYKHAYQVFCRKIYPDMFISENVQHEIWVHRYEDRVL